MNLEWVAQIVASLLGAGVGALALWLVYRSEKRGRNAERVEQYNDRLDRALVDLSAELWDWQISLRDFARRNMNFRIQSAGSPPPWDGPRPSEAGTRAALGRLRIVVGPDEREAVENLAAAVVSLLDSTLRATTAELNADVIDAIDDNIRVWRTGQMSNGDARKYFAALAAEVHREKFATGE